MAPCRAWMATCAESVIMPRANKTATRNPPSTTNRNENVARNIVLSVTRCVRYTIKAVAPSRTPKMPTGSTLAISSRSMAQVSMLTSMRAAIRSCGKRARACVPEFAVPNAIAARLPVPSMPLAHQNRGGRVRLVCSRRRIPQDQSVATTQCGFPCDLPACCSV